ncbi:MAG: stage II sporulation protein R [Firmicutes bacterium]|nr:stage II sporulation protein R [Bacillota bacterium]
MRITVQKLLLFGVIFIFSGTLFGFDACGREPAEQPLLRLHIRANSNEASDQAVKLIVRDAVIAYLEEELKSVQDFETAKKEVGKRTNRIRELSDAVLKQEGFSYKSAAKLANEYFPTRVYGDKTVESGYYDALVINLGSGAGDNWWCVIYPPLCYFTAGGGSEDVVYKSIIAEWFGGK